jgi:hypothetical protein
MSTKKTKKTSSKGTRKKVILTTEIENLDQYVNNFNWVPIPNTTETQMLISPIKIEDNDMFIYFFKRFLMQPYIRRYFIHKYRPNIDYSLVKLDYNDPYFSQKVKYMERKIKNKLYTSDFIIDIAQQLKENGGGHWTSLKRENGYLEYMDSDPFYYGYVLNDFNKLVKNLPNPMEIYGDNNKNKSQYLAKKSIQNLHKKDTFCQSWSLFFLTVSNIYPNISDKIKFQEKSPVLHEDKERQVKNFPDFFNNFLFLLDVWIMMINDDKELEHIIKNTQWENWKPKLIVQKLQFVKRIFLKNEQKIKMDVEMQTDLFCLDKDAITEYMILKKNINKKQ